MEDKQESRLGSFAGIEFHIESMSWEHGNRVVTHEYPLQNTPWIENLGNKARKVTLACYISGGDDLYSRRDQLLKAVAEGEGKLTLPSVGELTVIAESLSYSENPSIRRRVNFNLTFAEQGEQIYPSGSADTRARLAEASGELATHSATRFADTYNVAGLPSWVGDDAINALANSRLALTIADAADVPGLLNAVVASIPDNYSAALTSATTSGVETASQGRTSAQTAIGSNRTAIDELIRLQSLAKAGSLLAADTSIKSKEDAIAARDQLTNSIDAAQAKPGAPVAALSKLRAGVNSDTRARIARLPETRQYDLGEPKPPMVAAYSIYGDASRAEEIKARNNIKSPFRAPAVVSALTR